VSNRYSIVPGDFARDARAKDVHRRVMGELGTHSTRNGWIKLSQTKLADTLDVARESVNRAIRELVAWGYLEKRSQAQTGRAICFYRIIMDRPGEPDDSEPDSPIEGDGDDVSSAGDAGETCDVSLTRGGGTCDVPLTPTCDVLRHTRVTSHVTHIRSPLGSSEEPPNPRDAGEQVEGCSGKGEGDRDAARLLEALRADGVAPEVVEHLLRPILEARRFSARDKINTLRALRDRAKGIPPPALDKAAEIVLAAKVATIKPDRVSLAIAAVRQAGAMVIVRAGTPQWSAWVEYFRSADPHQAKTMARFDVWQVRAPWPPGHKPASATEAA
jgi:hypothetical protein